MGPGLRPYIKHDYPAIVYLAGRDDDGHIEILETRTVTSDVEAANHYSRGFAPTPLEALERAQQRELDVAKAAANRAFHEQRMSPRAQAEAAAADAAHSGHLASVPETPIKRRGRPAKAKAMESAS